MKNYRRAYRRYKKLVNLKRRARNYHDWNWSIGLGFNNESWGEFWSGVSAGEAYIWMRHTGRVCSCSMCSYKYDRLDARETINEQLHDR